MKMDDVNIEIIKQLKNGRKPYKKIADELAVTENTVRTRTHKMIAQGVIDICCTMNPESIPGHGYVIVGVKLDTMELVKKGEEFSRLKGVVSVSVVTGRYDLILTVLLKEGFGLLEFYTQAVSHVKQVQSVETFVVYKGFNVKVPYVL